MKVVTDKPMDISEMIALTGRDALYRPDKETSIRILNVAEGSEVDVDGVYTDPKGNRFGLKKVDNPKYEFVGFLVKEAR